MISQIPLSLALPGGATFENFVPGPNAEAFERVVEVACGRANRVTLIWGRLGTGKSHLLQAACRRAHEAGDNTAYLPMATHHDLSPSLLEGLESLPLVCVDDVECVAGTRGWEQALFDLYNRTEQTGTRLLIGATCRVADMGIELADLRSRLASGLALQLRDLSDEQRHEVLRGRARERGFEIPGEVVEFLLRRYPRDMHALIGLLEQLDRSTLQEQRRVTIPFIKAVLERSDPTTSFSKLHTID